MCTQQKMPKQNKTTEAVLGTEEKFVERKQMNL